MNSWKKAAKVLWRTAPILLGAVLLVSLGHALIPEQAYGTVFSGSFFDVFTGSVLGSFLAGNPIVSYVLGGELHDMGVSLAAVTAFILSWVTVGVVQLPAEALMLGRSFAIVRNISAFILSIVCAFIAAWVMML